MEIDVRKCGYYCEKYYGCYCFNSSKEIYAINPNEHNSCEANNDCYYKQLQQLKYDVECAELRNKYDKEQFDNELQQLKAENKELKEQYKLAEPLFQACKIKDLKIDKYKTILDEIEEICKKSCENCIDNNIDGCECNYEMCLDIKIEDILQKIEQSKEGGE